MIKLLISLNQLSFSRWPNNVKPCCIWVCVIFFNFEEARGIRLFWWSCINLSLNCKVKVTDAEKLTIEIKSFVTEKLSCIFITWYRIWDWLLSTGVAVDSSNEFMTCFALICNLSDLRSIQACIWIISGFNLFLIIVCWNWQVCKSHTALISS